MSGVGEAKKGFGKAYNNVVEFVEKKKRERNIVKGLRSDKRMVNKLIGKGKATDKEFRKKLKPALRWWKKTGSKLTNFE